MSGERMSMFHRLLAASAVWFALAGCTSATVATQDANNRPATPSTAATLAAPRQLAVGECTGPLGAELSSTTAIPAVDCDSEHAYEVFAVAELTTPELPDADTLQVIANNRCYEEFGNFVGVDPPYSRYSSIYLAPDAASWQLPELRRITCLLGRMDGGITGSARDDTALFPAKGQCTGPQDVPVLELEIVSCKREHSYEAYASRPVKGRKPPTAAQLAKLVNTVCAQGFRKFVGIEAAASKYEYTYLIAPAQLWDKVADHNLVCSAGSPKGGIKGSLKGAKA